MLLLLSWTVFLPLTHLFTFNRGEGPIGWLPGLGAGAQGGWWAAVVYIVLLGVALGARWRHGRWMSMRVV